MRIPVRHRLVGMLFAGSAVNFVDRVNISVAAPAMMAAAGLAKDQFGLVFSAFLLGYALMQIPSGVFADRHSPRRLLIAAFVGFSLFTALTPVAAGAVVWLLLVRLLIGVFEGPTFPAITSFNSRWFPPKEFGRAQTVSLAGGSVGQMLAYPMTAWIILQFSWEAVFYVSALLGLLWVAVWTWYARDRPHEHRGVDDHELRHIRAEVAPKTSFRMPLKLMLSSPPVLLLVGAGMTFALVLWTFLFWFPTYLIEARGFSLAQVAALGVAIQGCGFLGTVSSGILSDMLLRRTGNSRLARTLYPGVCIALAAGLLVGAVLASSIKLSICCFALFYFFIQSVHLAFLTTPAVLHPQQAASIYGLVNCFASLGAMCGPALAGFLMADAAADWARTFGMIATFGLLSAVLLFSISVAPIKDPAATRSAGTAL